MLFVVAKCFNQTISNYITNIFQRRWKRNKYIVPRFYLLNNFIDDYKCINTFKLAFLLDKLMFSYSYINRANQNKHCLCTDICKSQNNYNSRIINNHNFEQMMNYYVTAHKNITRFWGVLYVFQIKKYFFVKLRSQLICVRIVSIIHIF